MANHKTFPEALKFWYNHLTFPEFANVKILDT